MRAAYLILLFLLLSPFAFHLSGREKLPGKDTLLDKAKSGDVESMFALANEFFYGENRKRNYTLAAFWYRKTAEKGVPEGMYNFALCLEGGFGVKKDVDSALSWYGKAAETFDPARYRLANIYLNGLEDEKGKTLVKRSFGTALEHLEILNMREYEPGELSLARLFLEPEVPSRYRKRAYDILIKVTSRKKFAPAALRMLADCFYGGYGGTPDPQRAKELLEKAARLGDGEAMAKLGFLYEQGNGGCPKDWKKAFAYYEKAAGKNHPMALFKMAEALFEGKIRKEKMSLPEILRLYERSAAGNCPQAMFKLGVIYYEGLKGVPKNPGIAARCFYEGAKRGYTPCMYNFGCLFESGEGVRKDPAAAFYWFRLAAERGHTLSQRKAGLALLRGKGTNPDISEGRRFLQMAAEKGDLAAQRLLQE